MFRILGSIVLNWRRVQTLAYECVGRLLAMKSAVALALA